MILALCRRGGIGRRGRLKIYYSQECAGSSPVVGILPDKVSTKRSCPFFFIYTIRAEIYFLYSLD